MNDLSCVIGWNEQRARACHRHIFCQHPSSIKRVLGQFISAFEISHPEIAICLISQIQCVKLLTFLVFQYAGEIALSKRLTIYHWTSQNFPIRLLSPSSFFLPRSTHEKCVWSQLLSRARSSEHEAFIALKPQEREHDVELLERKFSLSLRIRWIPAACATSASALRGIFGLCNAQQLTMSFGKIRASSGCSVIQWWKYHHLVLVLVSSSNLPE